MDVAKLESNKLKLDRQLTEFGKLQENPSMKALEELAKSKNLTLAWNIDYNVPAFSADPNRLIQVLVNLIGNAIKFTESGGITVKVTRKNKNIRVEVVDTGIGISKEDKAKLFKRRFLQLRNRMTTQTNSGTGLGLSIVKGIVSLHGGRIGVDSEPGKGSTFWFTIPLSEKKKRQRAAAAAREAEKPKEPAQQPAQGQGT